MSRATDFDWSLRLDSMGVDLALLMNWISLIARWYWVELMMVASWVRVRLWIVQIWVGVFAGSSRSSRRCLVRVC